MVFHQEMRARHESPATQRRRRRDPTRGRGLGLEALGIGDGAATPPPLTRRHRWPRRQQLNAGRPQLIRLGNCRVPLYLIYRHYSLGI